MPASASAVRHPVLEVSEVEALEAVSETAAGSVATEADSAADLRAMEGTEADTAEVEEALATAVRTACRRTARPWALEVGMVVVDPGLEVTIAVMTGHAMRTMSLCRPEVVGTVIATAVIEVEAGIVEAGRSVRMTVVGMMSREVGGAISDGKAP